ncbi:MAG: hypothetical protein IKX32_08095 [Bacteroidales bacterium]|nr:hypothetical protein [Bacteroidales bacterium]
MYTAPRFLFCNNLLNGVQRALKPGAAAAYLHKNKMKTRTTVMLTAMACITLFTLFAYCTKDTPNPQENGGNGGGNTQTTLDLEGTTWKTNIPYSSEYSVVIRANFTTDNSGNYIFERDGDVITKNFTYKLNGLHGAVINNNMYYGQFGFMPNNAVIDIIDENTIGIGGRVFTKQ